jgi:hypothetical protein
MAGRQCSGVMWLVSRVSCRADAPCSLEWMNKMAVHFTFGRRIEGFLRSQK